MYAGMLFSLAEATGGFLSRVTFHSHQLLCIAEHVSIRYAQPALSDITVDVTLSEDAIATIVSQANQCGKAPMQLKCRLLDSNRNLVAVATSDYQILQASEVEIKQPPKPLSHAPAYRNQVTPISITSSAAVGPAQCVTQSSLWAAFCAADDTAARFPSRFRSQPIPETIYVQHGHFMNDVQTFDNSHFAINPAESASMDPHQRKLLEVSYAALALSGKARRTLSGSETGVFLGMCSDCEWPRVENLPSGFHATREGSPYAAQRISYVFGLRGPCISVNTVCSSSLVALDSACRNILMASCPSVLVNACNMYFTTSGWVTFCTMRAASSNGRCKTFEASADGFARSEACVAMMLHSLSNTAVRTALVQGSSVNQDGRSASMTAPSGPVCVTVPYLLFLVMRTATGAEATDPSSTSTRPKKSGQC